MHTKSYKHWSRRELNIGAQKKYPTKNMLHVHTPTHVHINIYKIPIDRSIVFALTRFRVVSRSACRFKSLRNSDFFNQSLKIVDLFL